MSNLGREIIRDLRALIADIDAGRPVTQVHARLIRGPRGPILSTRTAVEPLVRKARRRKW